MNDTVTQIHTFDQPIETSVKVGIEVDSKGQKKHSVEIKISRKIDSDRCGSFYALITEDLEIALSRCKNTLEPQNHEVKL